MSVCTDLIKDNIVNCDNIPFAGIEDTIYLIRKQDFGGLEGGLTYFNYDSDRRVVTASSLFENITAAGADIAWTIPGTGINSPSIVINSTTGYEKQSQRLSILDSVITPPSLPSNIRTDHWLGVEIVGSTDLDAELTCELRVIRKNNDVLQFLETIAVGPGKSQELALFKGTGLQPGWDSMQIELRSQIPGSDVPTAGTVEFRVKKWSITKEEKDNFILADNPIKLKLVGSLRSAKAANFQQGEGLTYTQTVEFLAMNVSREQDAIMRDLSKNWWTVIVEKSNNRRLDNPFAIYGQLTGLRCQLSQDLSDPENLGAYMLNFTGEEGNPPTGYVQHFYERTKNYLNQVFN